MNCAAHNTNIKGRGAPNNPVGRFEALAIEEDPPEDWAEEEEFIKPLRTQFFKDSTRQILSFNDSPDVGPGIYVNPYRGCEHGCIYCFARPSHEYLGLSAGLDFESKLFIKTEAPALLRKELAAKKYQPQAIALSSATDPYQPIERKLKLTRQCLEVLRDFRNPVGIITKNHLVTRDSDILQDLAAFQAVRVIISLTTLNSDLAKKMEPRTSRPSARLKAIEELARAGIPVGVNMAPVIPGLTDHEIPALLKAAADAGAGSAGWSLLRLSHGLKDLFQDWLEVHEPLKKERILGRLKDMRGGKLNDTRFGIRRTGEGPYTEQIRQSFALHKKKYGLDKPSAPLSCAHFRKLSPDGQMDLF